MCSLHVTAILLAAGKGERLGGSVPKQFYELAGKQLFRHSLDVLEASDAVDSIVLVLPAPSSEWQGRPLSKVRAAVTGGSTRQSSVAHGVAALPEAARVVLVHDAARPLLTGALIEALLAGLSPECAGTIPGIPLEDAIKKASKEGFVEADLDRGQVWRVQTPQVFFRGPLEDSLRQAVQAGRDSADCSHMLTQAGYRIRIVQGDPTNLKVTRPADLRLAALIFEARAQETEEDG